MSDIFAKLVRSDVSRHLYTLYARTSVSNCLNNILLNWPSDHKALILQQNRWMIVSKLTSSLLPGQLTSIVPMLSVISIQSNITKPLNTCIEKILKFWYFFLKILGGCNPPTTPLWIHPCSVRIFAYLLQLWTVKINITDNQAWIQY